MRTTVVGSYPVPDWLKASPTEEALQDALRVVLRVQEETGIDVISDGELSRWDLTRRQPGGMVERFVRLMGGVEAHPSRMQRDTHRARATTAYRPDPPGVVVGPLSEGRLDLHHEWQRVRRLTQRALKFTVTSPYMIGKLLLDEHYGDLSQLVLAVADVLAEQVRAVDAEVVQIDEPNLPGTPGDGGLAGEAIGRVLDAARGEKAVHLCFGNFGGQTIQQGHYSQLVEFLNTLRCDHLVLETTRRPQAELERLRDVDARIALGVGVIDVKDLQIESAEVVAQRIEALAKLVGPERLAYVHPDCGLQVLPRPVADGKLRALVQGCALYGGR
jgi:5-methyltetrahydropteroyltriglutamate--homocysteine methyltransferase